jgi:hypothetical protein
MLIIVDKKIPEEARINLQKYGELVLLETTGITEESISGHPDIFFFSTQNELIVAPNLPDSYKGLLRERKITFKEGSKNVEEKYPEAAHYNAVVTDKYIIHRADISDSEIIESTKHLQQIHVRQGFARCSLLPLRENNFITSDNGIYEALVKQGMQVLLVSPENIILPGHQYGFFGGTCGIVENTVFFLGSLSQYCDGEKVRIFLKNLGYKITELYNGPLFDGGSLLFISQQIQQSG